MKKAIDFNWLDSTINPIKAKKKPKKLIPNPFPIWSTISTTRYWHCESWCQVNDPHFLYVIIGHKYRKSGKLMYLLEPSVFNTDIRFIHREVEDSTKLDVWNEEKQKRQTRTEYAENPNRDEKST